MSKIHLTDRSKSTCIQQNRKYRGRAHSCNDKRPKHGDIEIIHAAIVGRLLRYMRPELGNLSWVSHETIAKELGINRTTVRAHLEAAVILGEARVRYSNPTTAHIRSSGRYPHYAEHTGGKQGQRTLTC